MAQATGTAAPAGRTNRRRLLRSVGGSAAARLITLPVSAVLGIVVTRMILDNYGEASYAQYMLLVGVVALIPFADLGISAAIMNATAAADDPRSDDHLRGTLVSALRVLAGCCLTMLLVTTVITLTGSWGTLLGDGLDGVDGERAAGLCLGAFALAMLFGYGQRILIGLHLNALTILITGLRTPLVLLGLIIMIALNVDFGSYVAVLSYAALVVSSIFMLVFANRRIRPLLGQAYRQAWRLRSVRGARIFDTAWPMLVQMVALPLAMQSNRLVLSHVSSVDELASYSLAQQIFGPVYSVSVAASMALWPVFARARESGDKAVSARTMSLVFSGFSVLAVTVMALASGLLAEIASGGRIVLPMALVIAFSLLMVIQAAKSPLGTFMTDARGLRIQAFLALGMLPVNLGISIALGMALGAIGPVIGSIIGVLAFQLIPNWMYVRRNERRSTNARDAATTASGE